MLDSGYFRGRSFGRGGGDEGNRGSSHDVG